ncbi:MAG: nickel pincer cofactor biosynthesis protein LarC [Gemmatimonadota bacterium]
MRGLIFDPFAGISGDMVLGALVDLGLPAEWLREVVDSLGVNGAGVRVGTAERAGVACSRVEFDLPHEHRHRGLSDVLAILDGVRVPPEVRERAGRVFRRIAQAEAEVHGIDVEAVHFHEVGALDTILDVLCATAGVAMLGYDSFYARPVAVGRGYVDIAHGRYPVPAPATARLLAGMQVVDSGFQGECTTPTGAALLAELTGGANAPPGVVLGRSGFGAGTRDPEDRPNCLRVMECDVDVPAQPMYVVQADMDDMAPEYVASVQQAVLDAGARDAVVHPVGMKKGRPGIRLEMLVDQSRLDEVERALFAGSSTIGVRRWTVERSTLERRETVMEWRGQQVRLKRVRLPDGTERSKPEYDDVERAARALGIAPYEARLAIDREIGGEPKG